MLNNESVSLDSVTVISQLEPMLSTSNKQARALRTNKRQLRHLACHKLNVYVNIKIRLFMKFAKTLLPGNNFPEGGFPDLASTSRS